MPVGVGSFGGGGVGSLIGVGGFGCLSLYALSTPGMSSRYEQMQIIFPIVNYNYQIFRNAIQCSDQQMQSPSHLRWLRIVHVP